MDIFYYAAYRKMQFLANYIYDQTNEDSFVACNVKFVTVNALTLQFNFYATLLALFHVQCCSVVFNKPNEDMLAYKLILLSFKPLPTVNPHGLNRSQAFVPTQLLDKKPSIIIISLMFSTSSP